MKTIKIIIKAILLWGTAISIVIFLCGGCEELMSTGYTHYALLWLLLNIVALMTCTQVLSIKDVILLSGKYHLDKFIDNYV